jgi:hypothetical protein
MNLRNSFSLLGCFGLEGFPPFLRSIVITVNYHPPKGRWLLGTLTVPFKKFDI